MKSETLDSFWEMYRQLPRGARQAAREAHSQFSANPADPSLRYHRLKGFPSAWSVRVLDSYRAVGIVKGDTISWIWIGTHADFDQTFG